MASLCERGEAFITCHCDLFAPWTGFKRGPTNFIGVNLATFSRTLYGMEPLTLHFSFEISKERERECVCLRERERRGRSFLFSAKYENNSWRSRMGRQAAEVKNWKIGVSSSVISKMKLIFFMEDVKSVCCEENWRREKDIEFIFIDLLWQKDTFRRFRNMMDHMENIWILFYKRVYFCTRKFEWNVYGI